MLKPAETYAFANHAQMKLTEAFAENKTNPEALAAALSRFLAPIACLAPHPCFDQMSRACGIVFSVLMSFCGVGRSFRVMDSAHYFGLGKFFELSLHGRGQAQGAWLPLSNHGLINHLSGPKQL